MKKSQFTEEQITYALHEVEVERQSQRSVANLG